MNDGIASPFFAANSAKLKGIKGPVSHAHTILAHQIKGTKTMWMTGDGKRENTARKKKYLSEK